MADEAPSQLEKIITNGYKGLGLEYFFTAGHDEVRVSKIHYLRYMLYTHNFRLGLSKEEVLHHVPLVEFIQILKRALLWLKLWIGQPGRNIELKLLSRLQDDIDNRGKLTSCRMVILYFSNSIRQTHRKRNNDDVMIKSWLHESPLDRVSYRERDYWVEYVFIFCFFIFCFP